MMVSQSIIKWLKEFSPDDMKHIDTDRMHGNVNYMLVKEPITNVKIYFRSGNSQGLLPDCGQT